MGNPAEGVSQTPMSFPTPSTLATSPDTGIELDDDVALKSLHMELVIPLLIKQRWSGRFTEGEA